MKYSKPKLTKVQDKLPPITTNFAPPPVEHPDGPNGEETDFDFLLFKRNGIAPNSKNGHNTIRKL